MTLSLKKRKNKISLLTLEDCVLVKKVKRFLAGIILSGSCLVCSVPVFAGNGSSNMSVTVEDISSRLDFIGRKVLFESTEQLLNSLSSVFMVLKSMEARLDFLQKYLVTEQFKSVLCQLRISNSKEKQLCENLSRDVNIIACMPQILAAPKLGPKKFVGAISEIELYSFGETGRGTERQRELAY